MSRYNVLHYEENGVKVTKVISHYAGKVVEGIAKCDPEDNFDPELGERIARLRCDLKVAKKREKNTKALYDTIWSEICYLKVLFEDEKEYLENATNERESLEKELDTLRKKLN